MQLRISSLFFSGVIFLAGCSGSGGSSSLKTPSCNARSTFCLTTCNLGCSIGGTCAVTEIAQNQPIVLQFSQDVDPASVTASTISIKTESGQIPAGDLIVEGRTITFQPFVRISGGMISFGFEADKQYILTMLGGDQNQQTLLSTSGDPLARTVVCALSVTQGLVDLDGQPPVGALVVPSVTTGVPTTTSIVVTFSELIDIGPFQGGSTLTTPIIYQLRKTTVDPTSGQVQCDSNFSPILIEGVPRATIDSVTLTTDVTLQPAIELPGNVCVEVIVTDRVRDLSGRPAVPQTFRFFTDIGTPDPVTISETFASDRMLDKPKSGGTWRAGKAIPAVIGGSGELGSFDATIGTRPPGVSNTYIWNTDNMTIPASMTLFKKSITVTDGIFEFTDLMLPAGINVIFQGSKPPIIRVRGEVSVEGTLSVDGGSPNVNYNAMPTFNASTFQWDPDPGEPGRPGGAFGGAGGKGGQSCDGLGVGSPPKTTFDGATGENIRADGSSGYSSLASGTAGKGALVWPADGLRASVTFNLFNAQSGQVTGGGGGGAFLGDALPGKALSTFTGVGADLGPDSLPGAKAPFTSLPAAVSVFDHYLVGGAGGGGGSSQPLGMSDQQVNFERRPWIGGGAGSGGGGALAMRVGGFFHVLPGGVISSRGGQGVTYTVANNGPPSPGGSGSGGSIVLQVADSQSIAQQGTLDVRGGGESRLRYAAFNGQVVESIGGVGGYGYVRLESRGGIGAALLGKVEGPPSVTADNFGPLTESDDTTAFQSLWYPTRQVFSPLYMFYKLTASIAGTRMVFSDEPKNFNPANQAGLPLRFYVQGGLVNPTTGRLEGEPGPWRDYVNGENGRESINLDDATGFRFMIMFDRTIEKDVVVEDLEVTFIAK